MTTSDYDNGILKIIVEDTGTGMTNEEQQRVFGAFERLSNAAAKDGFGLGLSIVQRIVTMLGGYDTAGERERQRQPFHGENTHADSRGTAGKDKSDKDSS